MARKPFDPSHAAGGKDDSGNTPARREKKRGTARGEHDHFTVGQLSELIKSTLEDRLPSTIRVIGEVSNLTARNHWYFSLKDEHAVVSCVAWASSAKKFSFTPSDGDEIVATGHVSHYGPQGRTQLYVRKIEPVGAGALELQFRKLCEELRNEGYFADATKIPLPVFPRRIAVITSATSAAVQDVIATAAQRCPAVGLLVVDVRVQGEGAAKQVAQAIRMIDRDHKKLGVDAIIVTRGGGSMEDLWAFNEKIVADAAFACELPLVAAIGHESDTTVIELVADVRAATPTQAAMLLVPSADELSAQVDHLSHRLNFLITRRIERARERLDLLARADVIRDPMVLIELARERMGRLAREIDLVIEQRVSRHRSRFESLARRWARLAPHVLLAERHERMAVLGDRLTRVLRARVATMRGTLIGVERELAAVDPRNVLQRGYSYTTDVAGELIRRVADAPAGRSMLTHVSDGVIRSKVDGTTVRRPRSSRRPRGEADGGESQMDLFAPDK